jgi:hypothetical protein
MLWNRKTSGGFAVRVQAQTALCTTARVVAGGRTTPAAYFDAVTTLSVVACPPFETPPARPMEYVSFGFGWRFHNTTYRGRWSQLNNQELGMPGLPGGQIERNNSFVIV